MLPLRKWGLPTPTGRGDERAPLVRANFRDGGSL
jgi:hypothetical protein